MFRRFAAVAGVAFALAATVFGTGLNSSVSAQQVAESGKVRIVLDCTSTPEKTEITNRSNDDITIEQVGTLADRTKGEPFRVNETLEKGKSITLESSHGAHGDVLTRHEIYNDDVNNDGARVRTSIGTFKERC